MEVDLTIAPDGFRPPFMSLDNALVNTRRGIFEIHISASERYGFAWPRSLPELKEDESVVVRAFGSKGLKDRFPLLWRVGVNARLAIGDRQTA